MEKTDTGRAGILPAYVLDVLDFRLWAGWKPALPVMG